MYKDLLEWGEIEKEFNASPGTGKAFKDLAIILRSRTTEERANEAVNEHKDNILNFFKEKFSAHSLSLIDQIEEAAWKEAAYIKHNGVVEMDMGEFVNFDTLKEILSSLRKQYSDEK